MNTAYSNNVEGALKLLSVNNRVYQIGKDAENNVGGIVKLFNNLDTYKASTDGAYNAKVVYDEIDAIKSAIGIDGSSSIADRIDNIESAVEGFDENNTIADAIAAAKSIVAAAANDYITVSASTNAQGNSVYTIGTTGIDNAISTAVALIIGGAPEAFNTLKEISDWISENGTSAEALSDEVASKANKVSNAVSGDFAGLDSNGNLTDSGFKSSDFQPAGSYKTVLSSVSNPTASGETASFIDSISQNTNGEIAVTKKNVQNASAQQAGLMSAANYNKLNAISATVTGDTLIITTQVV